jgi:hypothetical protein
MQLSFFNSGRECSKTLYIMRPQLLVFPKSNCRMRWCRRRYHVFYCWVRLVAVLVEMCGHETAAFAVPALRLCHVSLSLIRTRTGVRQGRSWLYDAPIPQDRWRAISVPAFSRRWSMFKCRLPNRSTTDEWCTRIG